MYAKTIRVMFELGFEEFRKSALPINGKHPNTYKILKGDIDIFNVSTKAKLITESCFEEAIPISSIQEMNILLYEN